MNEPLTDLSITELRVIVERAVRPVRASTSCKKKMREELLAHVSTVYEEEAGKLGDDRAALKRTALRFGNPAELTSQLQESVPASDSISRFFDFDGRPGDSVLRHAVPIARMVGAIALVIVIFGAALFAIGWVNASPSEALLLGMGFGLVATLYAFGLGLLTNGVEQVLRLRKIECHAADDRVPASGTVAQTVEALNGPTGRSWLPVVLIVYLCLFIPWCVAFFTWLPDNQLTAMRTAVQFAGILAASSVVLAWIFANSAAVRRLHHEKWACLPIEPTSPGH